MAELFNILGDLTDSERHVLMRCALRAKHLRFLQQQNNRPNEQRVRRVDKDEVLPNLDITHNDGVNGVLRTQDRDNIVTKLTQSEYLDRLNWR